MNIFTTCISTVGLVISLFTCFYSRKALNTAKINLDIARKNQIANLGNETKRISDEATEKLLRDPEAEKVACYIAAHEMFLLRQNYSQAVTLAFEVVEKGITPDLFKLHEVEDLELILEMFVKYSSVEVCGRSDTEIRKRQQDLQGITLDKILDSVHGTLNGTSPPKLNHDDDDCYYRYRAIQAFALFAESLRPQIAALRIQRDMKQRIDAVTAIPDAQAAVVAPVGTRRRMGTI